jgi:hypothetical protein
MQTHRIPAGSTSVIIPVEVWDSSSAVGAKLAGLAHDTASLTCYYNRAGATAGTAITLDVHPTQGTWSTRGFIAIDGTNMPGIYELHVPDACLATGARFCNITLKGASNMVPVDIHIELETVTTDVAAVHTHVADVATATALSAAKTVVDNILRWFTNRRHLTPSRQVLYADDGVTILHTQELEGDGVTSSTRGAVT